VARVFFLLLLLSIFAWSWNRAKDPAKFLFFVFLFFATLRLGYIFYRYNGILLADIPLLTLLALEASSYKGFRPFIPRISTWFLAFILWAIFVSIAIGWMQENSLAEVSKFVRAFLILTTVYNFVLWKKDVRYIVESLLLVIVFHSIVSIYQWRRGPVGLYFLGETGGWGYRAYGLFQHPNFLADYLAFVIPLVIRLFYFDRSNRTYFYGFVLLTASLSLFITFGRGAWIGMVLSVAVMLSIDVITQHFRKVKTFALIMSIVFGTAFLVHYLPSIQKRLFADIERKDSSAKIRVPLMKVALRMIKDKPIIGVGFTNYELWSEDYAFDYGVFSRKTLSQIVHNSYLLLAAEIGLPGLVIYLVLIGKVLKAAAMGYRSKIPIIRNVSIGILWGLVAVLLEFLTGPDYMVHEVLNMFWILSGIAVALRTLNRRVVRALQLRRGQLLADQSQTVRESVD